MSARRHEPSTRRVVVATRALFAAIAVGSLVFGYFGLRIFIDGQQHQLQALHPPQQSPWEPTSVINLLYYDIALFLLQSGPAETGGTLPWQLEVARFAAASFIAYTIAEIAASTSAERVRRARLRRASDHAVVCGNTRAARFLAEELERRGTRVVMIDEDAERGADPWVVAGDPGSSRVLIDAGVRRAAVMYACLDESQRNVEIVSAAERIRAGGSRPRKFYALVSDSELCVMLKARRWSSAEANPLHIDFFNPDELAAQATVRGDRPVLDGDDVPEVAIVGSGAFGRAVLVELAHQWLPRMAALGAPMRITLVADDAPAAAAQLRQRFAFIDESCVLREYDGSVSQLLADRQRLGAPPLRRLYLCQDVESEALKDALTAVAYLQSAVDSVVVRLDRMSGIADAFEGGLAGRALLDAFGGRLRVVDVVLEGCNPENIGDDLVETLARASHNRYIAQRLAEGVERDGVVAMNEWEDLPEDSRTANREQTQGIGRKMARIDCLLAPRSEAAGDFRFLDGEVELLAQMEHERWVEERQRHGWTRGDTRDMAAKRHPDLVPWSALTDASREKDRQAVRAIPGELADVGLGIIRVGPNPGTAPGRAAGGRLPPGAGAGAGRGTGVRSAGNP